MDFIRKNCPMAVMTEVTRTSEKKQASLCCFLSFCHPSGFILMKSKIAIAEKYDFKIFDRPLPYLYDMKKGKARKRDPLGPPA